MDKYSKLWEFFIGKNDGEFKLSFKEIQNIAGIGIDHSFLTYRKNLEKYGYKVEKISQKESFVIFKKINQLEIILVDENDQEIGFGEKMDVHKRGVLHRAISVLILNSKGEMLLQQRAMGKYHCPGLRSNATCTHPFPNESCLSSAHRRLQEEMGFDTDLKELFEFRYIAHFDNGLTENEYDHVFLGHYDGEMNLNPDEVADYKWIGIEELKKDIVKNADNYTQWFKIILEKYFSLLD